MRNRLVWVLNIVLLLALIVGFWVFVVDDDDESSAKPPPPTTTTTEPNRSYIPDGPHAAEIRRAIRGLDLSFYDDVLDGDLDDWELAIVKQATGEGVVVQTATETRLLHRGSCDDDVPDSYFESLYGPGDIAMFNNYGGDDYDVDDVVCNGEIMLIEADTEEPAE